MNSNDDNSIDDLRQKGNYEFQKGNLDNAVIFYTSAIEQATEKNNEQAILVNCCNRSACYFQLEDFEHAKEDATLAWVKSKQTSVKAAYRLAKTLLALNSKNELNTAIETLKVAIDIENLQPNEIQSLQQLLKQAEHKLSQPEPEIETTIKGANRPISIREFNKGKTLG